MNDSKRSDSTELTVGEYLSGILPRLEKNREFPEWPPDCFALCISLLRRTGAYSSLFTEAPADLDSWATSATILGRKWRAACTQAKPFTDLLKEWAAIFAAFNHPLSSVCQDRSLCGALTKLVTAADEASESVGAPMDVEREEDASFLEAASARLEKVGTLCKEIDGSRLRVLPRMHTPQNGLTDRSLSLYLSLCDSSEVIPQWLSTPFIQRDSINLLLIPWPREVTVSQFRDETDRSPKQLPDEFGFFGYAPAAVEEELVDLVKALWAEAVRKLGRIDGVVLPEMAVTEDQFRALRNNLPPECFVVSGVGRNATASEPGANEVRLSFPPLADVVQKKHHPWKLDEAQVIQYGLGGVLTPSRGWWEHADFTDRKLSFIAMSADIVLCVLICEDLARPDPVANVVRAVGPNLVIALLMDGPQIKERWAARYATILADDPGCSVLSLTSIGMSSLSRPSTGPSRSRVIALWKDAISGAAKEIEMPVGCDGIAVSLSIHYREEYTADGRRDDSSAAFPILSGVHPIVAPQVPKALS